MGKGILGKGGNTRFGREADKLGYRANLHFAHHIAAMDLDGFFGSTDLIGDLLIQ